MTTRCGFLSAAVAFSVACSPAVAQTWLRAWVDGPNSASYCELGSTALPSSELASVDLNGNALLLNTAGWPGSEHGRRRGTGSNSTGLFAWPPAGTSEELCRPFPDGSTNPFLFHTQCARGLGHAAVIADGWIGGIYAARTVICWGLNDEGQCDVPASTHSSWPQYQIVQVACGSKHTLSLQLGGFVQAWGWNNFGQSDVPPAIRDYGAGVGRIAAGALHSVALHHDGTLTCWGAGSASDAQDDNYRCGQASPPPGLRSVVDVAAGGLHTVALRVDGTVACWGAGSTEQTFNFNMRQSIVPTDLGPCVKVAAGAYSTAALTVTGQVRVWGWMQHTGYCSGQCDIPAPLGNVHALWVGFWGTVIRSSEPRPACRADIDSSCSVDGVDLGTLLASWGAQPPGAPADLDDDGTVDGVDLGLLLAAWGPCAD